MLRTTKIIRQTGTSPCRAVPIRWIMRPLNLSGLCVVLSIKGTQRSMMPGMNRNTVSMLRTMPLARTIPISKPIVKLMKTRESMPATVVNALEEMGMKVLASACCIASLGTRPVARMRSNAFISIME